MSNSKRSRKNHSNRQQSTQHDSQRQSDSPRRKRKSTNNTSNRCGDAVLSSSKLSKSVRDLINSVFNGENDLTKDLIEEPAVRLLEEVTESEALSAIGEFADRYKVAKHKILRSKAGYFRGVCQKYWKCNRETKKQELLRKASVNPTPGKYSHRQVSPLVSETIESLFTPASGLAISIIDDSVQRRLTQLTDEQAIEALHEFCSAVMYRQDRIRNMNAYLMNIIKRRVTHHRHMPKPETREPRPQPPPPAAQTPTRTRQETTNPAPVRPKMPRPIAQPPVPPARQDDSSSSSSYHPPTMRRVRSAEDQRSGSRPVIPPSGHADPRLVLDQKSNPVHVSFASTHDDSDSDPVFRLDVHSAPGLMIHHEMNGHRGDDPRLRPRVFSAQLPRPYPRPIRRPSPPVSAGHLEGYSSDNEEDNNLVMLGGYDDTLDDGNMGSVSEDESYSGEEEPLRVDPYASDKPVFGRGQRSSNGPPRNPNVPEIYARNSRPASAQMRRESDLKREVENLKHENEKLRHQLQQMQIRMDQMSRTQNQMLHYDSQTPSDHSYHMGFPAFATPPTSGPNVAMVGRHVMPSPTVTGMAMPNGAPLTPTSTGNPAFLDGGYPFVGPFPNQQPVPGFAPPFMPGFGPPVNSQPNAFFPQLSQPNSVGQAFVQYPAFVMPST